MSRKTEKLKMICIVCPLGCELEVETGREPKQIVRIKGSRCFKGKEYAAREVTDPRRVLMAVAKVRDGHLPVVSVKTDRPIPKQMLREAVKAISKIEIDAPVKAGDIVIENLLGTGARVVATNNVGKAISILTVK